MGLNSAQETQAAIEQAQETASEALVPLVRRVMLARPEIAEAIIVYERLDALGERFVDGPVCAGAPA